MQKDLSTLNVMLSDLVKNRQWDLASTLIPSIVTMNAIIQDIKDNYYATKEAEYLNQEENAQFMQLCLIDAILKEGASPDILFCSETNERLWEVNPGQWLKTAARLGNLTLVKCAFKFIVPNLDNDVIDRRLLNVFVMAVKSGSVELVDWLMSQDIDWKGIIENYYYDNVGLAVREYRTLVLGSLTEKAFKPVLERHDLLSLFSEKDIVKTAMQYKRHWLMVYLREKGKTSILSATVPHYIKFIALASSVSVREWIEKTKTITEDDAASVMYCLGRMNIAKLGFKKNESILSLLKSLDNPVLTMAYLGQLSGSRA